MDTFERFKSFEGKTISNVEQSDNCDTGSWIRKTERDKDITIHFNDGSKIKLTARNCHECADTFYNAEVD